MGGITIEQAIIAAENLAELLRKLTDECYAGLKELST